ncbi:hypothetical protein HYH02_004096 [Chlamydomonas schloesseri]|uniref:Uncharacterized protein n=1 Tax=Chlamydomonas schloesseri TaxID=2026947 RepID=A0A835WP83_9CHLO|nr:hypothetical protein HYH02_004096 [Chlamydomonas schloesseri]|eukprot:KAG2451498.1 hypothetical protein HYH02_004096 [Chlamydomonas schloesseri]
MQALAERTRQALHLGARDFRPTALEAERRALGEAGAFAAQLHALERHLHKWDSATEDMLRATSHFLTDAPSPRHFTQPDPTDPATLTAAPPAALPAAAAADPRLAALLSQPPLLRRVATGLPLAVGDAVQDGLEEPVAVWLAAHDAAKERLAALEPLRIRHDAARRAIHTAASAPGADQPGSAAHAHLVKAEEDGEPVMSEFEVARCALLCHLHWLAEGAAQLKAAAAAVAAAAQRGALRGDLAPPEGLIAPFPPELLADHPAGPPDATALATPITPAPSAAAPATPLEAAAGLAVEGTAPTAATAAAMTQAAIAAATTAAELASGQEVPPPQVVMTGGAEQAPGMGGIAGGGGGGGGGGGAVADAVVLVPPGTAGVAAEAAVAAALETAAALGAEQRPGGAASRAAAAHTMSGPAAARLRRLVLRPQRRAAVRALWRLLAAKALAQERAKGLPEVAMDQMSEVRERAGVTGGFLMRPEMAPEYVMAGRRVLPGGGPLQFLRDTLMGPSDAAAQHHAAAAVAAAAGTGASPKHRPPATPTTTPTDTTADTSPAATRAPTSAGPLAESVGAAAAREQMHEVATRGVGEAAGGAARAALGGALTSPTDTGVGRFIAETLTGPREKKYEKHGGRLRNQEEDMGKVEKQGQQGAGLKEGPGGAGLGGFVRDTLVGPPVETAAAVEHDTLQVALGSGGTALPAATTSSLASAARYQMSTATGARLQHMDVAVQPPPQAGAGAGAGATAAAAGAGAPGGGARRTPSGGPASFLVDTLMGPETHSPQHLQPGALGHAGAMGGSGGGGGGAVSSAPVPPPVPSFPLAAPKPLDPALGPIPDVTGPHPASAGPISREATTPEPPAAYNTSASTTGLTPAPASALSTATGPASATKATLPATPATPTPTPTTATAGAGDFDVNAPAAISAEEAEQRALALAEQAAAAAAALTAADAAVETSAASMDAATAAVDAAVAATSVAAAALEAATDATVMALDSAIADSADVDADVDVDVGTSGGSAGLRPATPPSAQQPSVESAAPEAPHTLGLVGAGGQPGPSSVSGSDLEAADEAEAAAAASAGGGDIGGAAGINIGLSPAAAMVPSSPPLESRPLHTVAAGRPHVSPAAIPEHARTYGRIGAGGEPGHGRRTGGGSGAGVGDVSSSSDVEEEAPVAMGGGVGAEARASSGIPGAFGAVKSLIEEAAAGGGAAAEAEKQKQGAQREGKVTEPPAGPALVEL